MSHKRFLQVPRFSQRLAAVAHRSAGIADPLPALRTAIGDANLTAIWMADRGVTEVSGAVSQWDDARGAGFWPSMVQGTATKRPIKSVGGDGVVIVTTDGVDDVLQSGGIVLHSNTQSIGIVGHFVTGGVNVRACGLAKTAVIGVLGNASLLYLWDSASHFSAGTSYNTIAAPNVADAPTRRLAIACSDPTDVGGLGSIALDIPNKARLTAVGGSTDMSYTSASCAFSVGDIYDGWGQPAHVAIAAAFVISREVTAGDLVALKAFATALNYVPA